MDQWHAEETLEAEGDDSDDHWPADRQDDQDDQWHEEMLEADESLWPAQKDDRDIESTLSSYLPDLGTTMNVYRKVRGISYHVFMNC